MVLPVGLAGPCARPFFVWDSSRGLGSLTVSGSDMDERVQEVLDLWFPDHGHWKTMQRHTAIWNERMPGGMDDVSITRWAWVEAVDPGG